MKKNNLKSIDLSLSENTLEKISKIAEAQYCASRLWHAGGALGNCVAIRKINFWDVEHICVSGFFSPLNHIKLPFAFGDGTFSQIGIKSFPHYNLAHYIVNKHHGHQVNCEQVCLPECSREYINYYVRTGCLGAKEARDKMQYFVNLATSISRDMSSLIPWRGEIVCFSGNDPGSLSVMDGTHRIAILAALGYEVIPTAMYVGMAEKILDPHW